MENTEGLGQILSDQLNKIKKETTDWFQFVPQSEVME